jgi:hypothetical protein
MAESRHYYFYPWDGDNGKLGKVLYHLIEISGYPTIAKIPMKGKINAELQKFRGKYLVLGKTMTYCIVDVMGGEVKILAPTNLKKPKELSPALGPICKPKKGDKLYKAYIDVLYKDAYNVMLSKNARYISLAQNSSRSIKILDTHTCSIVRDLKYSNGKDVIGAKATFSFDSRFIAFHSFGQHGKKEDETGFIEFGKLKRWADRRKVINIFIYDIISNKMVQLTQHSRKKNPGAAVYPDWTLDNQLVFNYHHRGEKFSRIRYYPHALELFRTSEAFFLSEKSIVNKPLNQYVIDIAKKQKDKNKVKFDSGEDDSLDLNWSIVKCKNPDDFKKMKDWQKRLCEEYQSLKE